MAMSEVIEFALKPILLELCHSLRYGRQREGRGDNEIDRDI